MFLRLRGNVKEMERTLGLSYRRNELVLEEAFDAAGFGRGESDRTSQKGKDSKSDPGPVEPRRHFCGRAAEQIKQSKERR